LGYNHLIPYAEHPGIYIGDVRRLPAADGEISPRLLRGGKAFPLRGPDLSSRVMKSGNFSARSAEVPGPPDLPLAGGLSPGGSNPLRGDPEN